MTTTENASKGKPSMSAMTKLIAYVSGALALVIVAASAGSALTYAATHGTETLGHLGDSVITGVGMAVGGCLGSALVLRFKAARRFVASLIKEINEKHHV
jgi:uncharacterized membrane protein YfcA